MAFSPVIGAVLTMDFQKDPLAAQQYAEWEVGVGTEKPTDLGEAAT